MKVLLQFINILHFAAHVCFFTSINTYVFLIGQTFFSLIDVNNFQNIQIRVSMYNTIPYDAQHIFQYEFILPSSYLMVLNCTVCNCQHPLNGVNNISKFVITTQLAHSACIIWKICVTAGTVMNFHKIGTGHHKG